MIDQISTPRNPAHRKLLGLMVAGCCLAIPLALLIAGVTAGGLAGASSWLLAGAAVIAVALVFVHRRSAPHRCDPPALSSDPQPGNHAIPYSARMPSDRVRRRMRP